MLSGNLFNNVALVACLLRYYDRAYHANLAASASFLASVLGQWAAHREARRSRVGAVRGVRA